MLVNGRFGGFGMGAEENSNVLMYRLDMAPSDLSSDHRSVSLAIGAIVRNTKVAQEQALWCTCQQVGLPLP